MACESAAEASAGSAATMTANQRVSPKRAKNFRSPAARAAALKAIAVAMTKARSGSEAAHFRASSASRSWVCMKGNQKTSETTAASAARLSSRVRWGIPSETIHHETMATTRRDRKRVVWGTRVIEGGEEGGGGNN